MVQRLIDIIAHVNVGTPTPQETTAPFLENQVPAPGSPSIDLSSNIAFRVTDANLDGSSGVDVSTLVISLRQGTDPFVSVYSGFAGGAQPGFAVTVTMVPGTFGRSYDVVINPLGFFLGALLTEVAVEVNDTQLVPNHLATSYTFTTRPEETDPPVILNQVPAPGAVGVLSSTNISFRLSDALTDPDSGVDVPSLDVEIRDQAAGAFVFAIQNGAFVNGFVGSITANPAPGIYDIIINPPVSLTDVDTTTVRVNVDDTKGTPNHLTATYSFTVAADDPAAPVITNQVPAPNAGGVAGSTTIVFDITDVGSGVDLSTLDVYFEINGGGLVGVILNGAAQAGYAVNFSAIPDGFHVEIDPDVDFDTATTVEVTIENGQDLTVPPNVMTQVNYSFSTVFATPVCVLAARRIDAIIGSIIQLDGRRSYSPDNAALTWVWTFTRVPIGSAIPINTPNPVALTDLRPSSRAAVSFIPDVLGEYIVRLVVSTSGASSSGCTVCVHVGLSRAVTGIGRVPDARFLWGFLSNFWNLVEDRDYIQVVWSSVIQILGGEYVKAWSNDFNKSLDTIQQTVQRKWQRLDLRTTVRGLPQRVIVGNTADGSAASTGEFGSPGSSSDRTTIIHAPLGDPATDGADNFALLDINYGARGRVIDLNGVGHTIDRVYNSAGRTFIITDEQTVIDGQANVDYRIPHLLYVPNLDFEADGVRPGDILVFEVRRRDINVTAELRAQVVVVDRERVGFEFTLGTLEVGGETVDHALFRQLIVDLRIVPSYAADVEIAAAAEALIAYMPTGINLSVRPFSTYQITISASHIIHNSWANIPDTFVSVPNLQEDVREDPPYILQENFDYILEDGFVKFVAGTFSLDEPSPEQLWAETVFVDNSEVIERNFGSLVELKKDDLVAKATRAPYLGAVRGLWYALTSGPTVASVRLGLQILMGLPFSEERGQILSITPNFSTDTLGNPVGRILAEDIDEKDQKTGRRRIYFFPQDVGLEINPATGVVYAANDIFERFVPLSTGVEVTDYVRDPRWWVRTLANNELLKFFTFRATIDTETGVFNENDLVFALDFVRKIKPAYTRVVAAVLRSIEDDVLDDFEDVLTGRVRLQFYENTGPNEARARGDDLNAQGVVLWRGDSRPFATRSFRVLRDVATAQNGTDVRASSVAGFGLCRVRNAGDATHPTIEGDLLVIQPDQAGSGSSQQGVYEMSSGTLPNGPVVLGNFAQLAEPTTWVPNVPTASIFPYGTNLICSVVRRIINPLVRGVDLATTHPAAIQLATSASGAFNTDGVAIDDHLIIEAGANAGEYRIVSTVAQTLPRNYLPAGVPQITATQLGLVTLDGADPALTDLTNQDFRIVRPSLMRMRVPRCRVVQSGGNMFLEVLDFGAPTEVPFDYFTPGMVGQGVNVQNAENPLNNGSYTILAYVHAGRVRITTGSPQTSDASPTAVATISSRYHGHFERAEELGPVELFNAVVS